MSVKLYRHNESGEVVAAILNRKSREFRVFHSNGYLGTDGEEWFLKKYTALPEAPEVEEWQTGEIELEDQYFWFVGKIINIPKDEIINIPILFFAGRDAEGWMHNGESYHLDNFKGSWKPVRQETSPPKPIVTLLPHEFVKGHKVLVRDHTHDVWICYLFSNFMFNDFEPYRACSNYYDKDEFCFKYCLPYAENAHLEFTITDGEHGAVPKGYVPPHVPKLGDDDYWQVGDEVINLSTLKTARVVSVFDEKVNIIYDKNNDSTCFLGRLGSFTCSTLRVWFHSGSTVEKEHIPTRPHKIEE